MTSRRGTNKSIWKLMELIPDNIYHIYNRGIDRQTIFFNRKNYLFFLKKMRDYLNPYINFLSYCLMPNHFHFQIQIPTNFNSEQFNNGFKILLSSYSRAINNQEQRTGSLFQQNTKAKCLTDETGIANKYSLVCFNYIHRNPVSSNLTDKMENWEFSSFKDYSGERNGNLCKQRACSNSIRNS